MSLKNTFFLLLLLFSACSTSRLNTPHQAVKMRPGQAIVSVYLTSSGIAEHAQLMQIEELAVEVDNVWIGLGLPATAIDYQQQKGQQLLLGAVVAPLGEHRRLRLRVSGLSDSAEPQQFILSLPGPLELKAGDSKCLFLDWQMLTEASGSLNFMPRFLAWGQSQTLGGELLYVASQDIDTVYILRMDINEVVASFGVPGPLAEIRLHQRRLYVLSRGKRAILVYDCLSGRLLDQIALPGAVSPTHMALSTDGAFAYVADAAAGEVLKVDLAAGSLAARVIIGHKPQRLIAFMDGQERLAITAPNSQQVFILDAGTLQTQRIIPVGRRPVSLLFFNQQLYVAEQGTQSVSVFDLNTGQQTMKIPVGFRPEYLLAIDRSNAYVSNSGESTLSALHAGQQVAIRKISAGDSPAEWIYSQRKRLLYVASSSLPQVTVVNRSSEQFVKEISLGGRPTSLAILE